MGRAYALQATRSQPRATTGPIRRRQPSLLDKHRTNVHLSEGRVTIGGKERAKASGAAAWAFRGGQPTIGA